MHKTISATEARIHFGELMRRVVEQKEAIIVERSGKPQVAIMPIDEFERLRALRGKESREQALQYMETIAEKVRERRKTMAVPEPEDLIRQMREERDEELRARMR